MDLQWHGMLAEALFGEERRDRTGVGTFAAFGLAARFDLRAGFPACTTKRLAFRQVAAELAAFLEGAENLADFHRLGCAIWDGNAASSYWKPRSEGDVGRIYGVQWRDWRSVKLREQSDEPYALVVVDQLRALVDGLRRDPHGRRHLVTAWNPGELDQMCLPPCHVGFQCFASDAGGAWLDLAVHLRSLDLFLGMPFDVASYALLCHLLAQDLGRKARRLIFSAGDAHVYKNHLEQVGEVMRRAPRPLPSLELPPEASAFNFAPDMARLVGYSPHPAVPATLNV